MSAELYDLVAEARPSININALVRLIRRKRSFLFLLKEVAHGFALELHILDFKRKERDYLLLANEVPPANIFTTVRPPVPIFSTTKEILQLEQARNEEGKSTLEEDAEENEELEAERVEIASGRLNGVGVGVRVVNGNENAKVQGGGRPKAFSPGKEIINGIYSKFSQQQRLPENEMWMRSRISEFYS